MIGEILIASLTLMILVYIWFKKARSYWTEHGVYQIQSSFPLGNFGFFFKSQSINDWMRSHTEETKGLKYFGAYFVHFPIFIIRDVDLVKQIMVKDFHGIFENRDNVAVMMFGKSKVKADIINRKQLLNAQGDEWKSLRSTFSPLFTAGKMKMMIPLIQETCSKLITALHTKTNEDFELKKMLGKYSMDTIASCAFGVDAQCFQSKDSQFVKHANNFFKFKAPEALKFFVGILPFGPAIMSYLDIPFSKVEETEFFYNVVKDTLNQRKTSKSKRNDLVDMMLDAINGKITNDRDDQDEKSQYDKDSEIDFKANDGQMDDISIAATAMVFLIAGYDTTGSALSFACYQLSKNTEVQEKLRREIDDVMGGEDNNDLTYSDIQNMEYLEAVICETLRFHCIIAILARVANTEYKVPGTDLILPPDTQIQFDIPAIHFDPEHYANAQNFDPEHFSKEAKAKRHPYAFLAFGHGPRSCIGMRFALVEAKMALARIVKEFIILPSDKTQEPLKDDPSHVISYPQDGLYVRVEKRQE